MALLTRVLVAVVLACAVEARAQGHEPAPAATPHAAAHEEPHPGGAPAAARKVPTVSRVAAPTPRVTAPIGAVAHEAVDSHAPAVATGGYVATGARPKTVEGAAHGAGGRPKPVVSGGAVKAPIVAEPAHGAAAPVATAAESHASEPVHGRAAAPAAVAPRDAAQRPVRLADVHTRLAAALADARVPTVRESGGALVAHEGVVGSPTAMARLRRVVLAWPGPRWQVAWPAAGRVTVRWPQPAVPAEAAAVPAGPQQN